MVRCVPRLATKVPRKSQHPPQTSQELIAFCVRKRPFEQVEPTSHSGTIRLRQTSRMRNLDQPRYCVGHNLLKAQDPARPLALHRKSSKFSFVPSVSTLKKNKNVRCSGRFLQNKKIGCGKGDDSRVHKRVTASPPGSHSLVRPNPDDRVRYCIDHKRYRELIETKYASEPNTWL